MTKEEAKSFIIDISYKLGNMAVEYLTEKDGEKMREAIKTLEQEPPWIPISERLPEEETDVLICNENGDIEFSRGSYSTEVENDFIWYTSGWRFGKVIAWMPLPVPFKLQ